MATVGETEFGGEDGIIMPTNIARNNLTGNEQLMTIYATNPGNAESTDADLKKTWELDPERVGKPESYGGVGWE